MAASSLRVVLAGLILIWGGFAHGADAAGKKKIVLIAGKKSHGPEGNGIHDYPWSVKLLKVMLDNSNIRDKVAVEFYRDGWPADPAALDDADTILVVSDGRDGDLYEEAPHLTSEAHVEQVARQIARGCGFMTFHFSTFAPDARAREMFEWTGGYFDWETDGKREWYSAIQTLDTEVALATPDHPVLRGVTPVKLKEEFYYNLRFDPEHAPVTPLWTVPAIPGRDEAGKVVAWARERANGGRGFGTTCGHFYDNWKEESFRKLILNALAWTAKVDVPADGVTAKFYTHAELTAALAGVTGTQPAIVDERPIKALILTGHHYPGHLWKDTTPAIREALALDPRLQVEVSEDIEDLATDRIKNFDLLVLNYCNWEKAGLSVAAKAGFVQYLQGGGGLCIIHFANGAFHFSLPNAGDSDWPEFRKICRRAWDHTPNMSGHDAYGRFVVDIADAEHPITRGMEPFETVDELYFRQQGDEPIHVIATAKSKVTGQDEPQAFVYDYGKGRIFQMVLGHAAESLRAPGEAVLLCRAAAWVSGRTPTATVAAVPAPPVPPAGQLTLVEGRFGKALETRSGGAHMPGRDDYRLPPLTVDGWVKLRSKSSYNIVAAQELKNSATHWELFSMPGSGHLTAYLPGYQPDHVRAEIDVADGQWHYVGLVLETGRARLFADGRQVADQAIAFQKGETVAGGFAIGQLVGKEIGCDGQIDELRLTRGVRDLTAVPEKAPLVDPRTLGLWRFDKLTPDGKTPDESPVKNAAFAVVAPAAAPPAAPSAPPRGPMEGHFAEGTVGFNWTENDSIDNRWSQTNVGSFLASILPLPDLPTVQKGLSIQVGEPALGTLCYDTALGSLRAGWTGGFLQFHPARYGLIESPRPKGDIAFAWPPLPTESRYRGMYQHGQRVVLELERNGQLIREAPWARQVAGTTVFERTFEFPNGGVEFAWPVAMVAGDAPARDQGGWQVISRSAGDQTLQIAVRTAAGMKLRVAAGGRVELLRPADAASTLTTVYLWRGTADPKRILKGLPAEPQSVPWREAGAVNWPEVLETRGELGTGDGPYVIDTLTLPFENPWKALIFTSGHDFFANGDLAVCTVHGDVWRVSDVDRTLQSIRWRRYATGLFQPLGLKIVGDQVYVLGRDQITRLHDRNSDGEADWYECFHNAGETSPGGHDYVTCLETDAEGRFYYIHATQGILRTGPDGRGLEVIASGFRNPNGLGVSPDGIITAAPQEGEWTPSSNIVEVKPGGYYGYPGPNVTAERPLGYDLPICWIPRRQDNSAGGQCWVTSDQWGPLQNQLLHFSFGQCTMLLTLREAMGDIVQGGTISFPFTFASGAMRGRFSPHDGQLYVTGLKGWVTSAVQDGCLQRVRYTGHPVGLPTTVKTWRNGLQLTFTEALDRELAEDPDRYQAEAWNYRYAADYGSAEFLPGDARRTGRLELPIRSATLLDPRTVFLEIPELQPVHQLALSWRLKLADGTPTRQTLNYTIHKLGEETLPQDRLTIRPRTGLLPEEVTQRVRPGLDAGPGRHLRLLAWQGATGPRDITVGSTPSYLKVPFSGEYRFRLEEASAPLTMTIGEQIVFKQQVGPVAETKAPLVSLSKGFQPVHLKFEASDQNASSFRVLWSSEEFDWEPIPPALLWHDPGQDAAAVAPQEHVLNLFEEARCARCHAVGTTPVREEFLAQGPSLAGLANRRQADWVQQWILSPRSLRPSASMPHLFDAESAEDRQAAADVAAWLRSLPNPSDQAASTANDAEAGLVLFEDLGCISCHRLTPPAKADDYERVSLAHAGAKFTSGALERFLENPQAHYPASKMPKFALSAAEIGQLAAYLRKEGRELEAGPPLPAGDANRGRKAFEQRGCNACHATDDQTPPTRAIPIANRERGCLAADAAQRGTAPDFALAESDQRPLRRLLKSQGELVTGARSPLADSQRLVRELNCRACHPRDGQSSPRGEILVDESDRGKLPEGLPDLTWAGEKLQPDWVRTLLKGELTEPTRPWMKARMPAFPAYADRLAAGLVAEHGRTDQHQQSTDDAVDLVELGRKLTLKDGGLDCRQCHGIGRLPPHGDKNTQIAPGINFADVRQRLQPDFYTRFVLNPPRYELNTRMPKLSADGRTTKATAILQGNAPQQFDALWHYIQTVRPNSE